MQVGLELIRGSPSMHWRIWHGNKMHTFKVNLLLLAQNLFFSFIHFCSKLPMSIRMHVWCWYLSNVNNLLFLTLCISTWQVGLANFFTLMYFFFIYLLNILSRDSYQKLVNIVGMFCFKLFYGTHVWKSSTYNAKWGPPLEIINLQCKRGRTLEIISS